MHATRDWEQQYGKKKDGKVKPIAFTSQYSKDTEELCLRRISSTQSSPGISFFQILYRTPLKYFDHKSVQPLLRKYQANKTCRTVNQVY